MKRLKHWWREHWRLASVITLCSVIVAGLLLFRLGSLAGNMSAGEAAAAHAAGSWHNLVDNPLYAPLKAVQWLLFFVIPHHGQTITRLPSVLFGVSSIWAFAYILRNWYGVRTAIFGTILFAFSSWFLHAARLADFDIMYLWGMLMLIATHIMVDRAKRSLTLLTATMLTALILYIPGMVWLIALNLVWQWGTLWHQAKELFRWWHWLLAIFSFAVLVALLGWAFWQDTGLIRTWLGAPNHFASVFTIIKQFAKIPW
ncbi:MAG TPA: hypothetical protein V6C72_19095, partial [Chroococcales cyanobacterium]